MNIIITIALLFGNIYILYNRLKNASNINRFYYAVLFFIHFMAFYFFYIDSIDVKRDSFLFYQNALEANSLFDFNFFGSQFMSVLAYPFAKIGISYFTVSLLFTTISFSIFLRYFEFFFKHLNESRPWTMYIVTALFLTPSLHYWTAGFTKEAALVYLMGIILFETINSRLFSIRQFVAITFILFIRPYLFLILVVALAMHILNSNKVSSKFKKNAVVFLGIGFLISIPILKIFLNLESISISGIQSSFESLITYSNANGASSIDLESTNYLDRFFLVLFQPLFFGAKNFHQYVISIENLLFILIIFKFIYDYLRGNVKTFFKNYFFIVWTSSLLILFYSIYMYNLGLASRMRSMYILYLYTFIFMCYSRSAYDPKKKTY